MSSSSKLRRRHLEKVEVCMHMNECFGISKFPSMFRHLPRIQVSKLKDLCHITKGLSLSVKVG